MAWTALVIYLVLLTHLYFLGFPIIMGDSHRYMGAAMLKNSSHSRLIILCVTLGPLVWAIGVWGFPIFSMSLLTYVLCATLKHLRKNVVVGSLAVVLSAAGFVSSEVMMDIYSAIGLLALYLVLSGKGEPILYFIIGTCYITHYGNILLFPLVCLFYLATFGKVDKRLLITLALVFFIPVLIQMGHFQVTTEEFRLFPTSRNTYLVENTIFNMPSITRGYIISHPDSKLAEHADVYENDIEKIALKGEFVPYRIYPFKKTLMPILWRHRLFENEARDIVSYALLEHKWTLIRFWTDRTVKFLSKPDFHQALVRSRTFLDVCLESYPRHIEQANGSLQQRNMLSLIVSGIFLQTYYLGILMTILVTLVGSIRRKYIDDDVYKLAVFCLFVLIFNAIIMTAPGGYGRYQVRVLLLPTLLLCTVMWNIVTTPMRWLIAPQSY